MNVIGIITGILVLSVMMIVHELGHYLTGRKLGFKIEEFSIFMGPVLWEWEKNDIKYNLKLLPIGASVRFAGEYGEEEQLTVTQDTSGHFYKRPKWARAIVLVTGPALNLLSGVLAFLIMFTSFGFSLPVIAGTVENTLAYESGLQAGDSLLKANGERIRTTLDYSGVEMFLEEDTPLVLEVKREDGTKDTVTLLPKQVERYRLGITILPELQQGGAVVSTVDSSSNNGQPVLAAGDIIIALNGIAYGDGEEFRQTVEASAGQELTVTVLRDNQQIDLKTVASAYLEQVPVGVYFAAGSGFGKALAQSFQWAWSIVKVTVRSIGKMFSGAIRPQDALSGPVGVVSIIGEVVQQKQPLRDTIFELLWLFALISVSLGFMNLLPIPPLDGNHLLLTALEAIRGKRLSLRTQNVIGFIGFALIIGLALLGLAFDVLRLAGH